MVYRLAGVFRVLLKNLEKTLSLHLVRDLALALERCRPSSTSLSKLP